MFLKIKNLKFFLLLILSIFYLKVDAQIDLDFSHKRGYYNSQFQLTITADKPNTIIKYTTNNTQPSVTNGLVYSSPLSISTTTAIKAIAYNQTDTGSVRCHSYLFLNDVINDANFYSYITTDPQYANLLETAFKSLPVVSLVGGAINPDDNIDLEIPVSTELFFPDGSKKGFMVNNGLQTWGGSSTNPKKNYRLEFKEIYGPKKLNYKLYEPDNYDDTDYGIKPVNEFDVLLLRAGSQDALNGEFGNENLVQYVRNMVMFDMQMAMGNIAPHGRFVHLFINGKYNGQYNLMERPDPAFFESYFGDDEQDYEVYKNGEYWNQKDSITTLFNTSYYFVNLSNEQAIINTKKNFDLDNAADYLVLMSYAGGWDWSDFQNCLSGGNINPGQLGYKYILWDVDYSFGNGGIWHPGYTGDITYFNAPIAEDGPIPDNLLGKLEFKVILSDRMTCACYNDGVLTPTVADDFYMHRVNQVSTSLIAESAKWGNNDFTYTGGGGAEFHIAATNWDVNDEFMTELNRVRTDFIPNRTAELIKHYRSKGITSNLEPVKCSSTGGKVQNNTTITLTNPNTFSSEIYYTIDGTDPRAVKGEISSTAKLYTGPITLTKGTKVLRARIRSTSYSNTNVRKWSSMCPIIFYVDQNYQNLVINEIHYNPADSIVMSNGVIDTIGGKNFEFIEIKNTGNDIIYLQDVQFDKGLRFKFNEQTTILPYGFVVLAKNEMWFTQKYGFEPDGEFLGKLSNSGERIWLSDSCGEIIDSLSYQDRLPWDATPDNGLYSLALVDNVTDNTLPGSWKAQDVYVTPKAANQFCDFFSYDFTLENISCNGKNDGYISVNIQSGVAPYSYNWSTGHQSNFINNLAVDDYSVVISDNAGCTQTLNFSISEPALIIAQVNTTNSNANNFNGGSAALAITGGTAPYTYTWSDGSTTNNISNLTPGVYSVSVFDANSCSTVNYFEILPENCYDDYSNLNNATIYTGLYSVKNSISVNGKIEANSNVLFEAGKSITLNNNFDVSEHADFEINISPCD